MRQSLHETYRAIEEDHWWFVGRRKILYDTLERVAKPGARILDVGCNTGVLVKKLQSRGYDAWGTDLSADAILYGTEHGTDNLRTVTADRQPFEDAAFDIVMALDVIEHIDDDAAAIREMRRVLKPGGLIIVKVPAYMFLWGVQDEAAHHKRRYTAASLGRRMKGERFEPVRLTYFNTALFLPIAASRFLQRIIRSSRGSDFDLNNRFINRVFSKIFLLEASLLKRLDMPFGVSLLYVGQKRS